MHTRRVSVATTLPTAAARAKSATALDRDPGTPCAMIPVMSNATHPAIRSSRRCGYSTAPSLLIVEQKAIAAGPHTECSLTVRAMSGDVRLLAVGC
jgi:hypothetical protein